MLSTILAKFTDWQTAAEGLLDGYLIGSITLSQFLPAQQATQSPVLNKQQGSEPCPESNQKPWQEGDAPAKEATATEADDARATGRVMTQGDAAELGLRGAGQPYRSSVDLHQPSTAACEQKASQSADSTGRRQSNQEAGEAVNQTAHPELEQVEQRTANGHVEQDEAALLESGPGDRLQDGVSDQQGASTMRGYLSVKMLKQLLKSALSIELDVGDLPDRLLHALKLQQWRFRASAALAANTKYTGECYLPSVEEI